MIERLALTNFKAFPELELGLGPLTLLTGLNSSGKSTVLQAFALLQQSYQAGQLELGREPGLLLNGELVELGTGADVLHEDFVNGPYVEIAVADGGHSYAWSARYLAEQDLLPVDHASSPATHDGANAPSGDAAFHPQFFSAGFQYLHADRISPATSYPRSHLVAVQRGFLGTHGEHTVNFLRHHARSVVPEGPLRHPRAAGDLLADQVEAWMRELCPGIKIEVSALEGADEVRLAFGFGETGAVNATRRRRPTNVGFGLTYALPIVVACLTARPGSLVMIENPEAHLHPMGQTRMAALAAAAGAHGAQVLIETHSDHVLNGARLAVKEGTLRGSQVLMHYFRGNDSGLGIEVVSPTVGDDGMLDQWPVGFFDELENTLDKLLD